MKKHNYMQFAEKLDAFTENENVFEWPNLTHFSATENSTSKDTSSSPAKTLNADEFACARFITHMVRYLAVTTEYHVSYQSFFTLLKGIALLGREERQLMVKIGTIRAIVGYYLNDWFHLHFNRSMAGKDNNGKKQYKRMLPPRVSELVELLSILIRSCSTPTYPLQSDLNKVMKLQGINPEEIEKKRQKRKARRKI